MEKSADQQCKLREECELAVLYYGLIDRSAFSEVSSTIAPEAFLDPLLRQAFVIMQDLDEIKSLDMPSFRQELMKQGIYERIGGGAFIGKLMTSFYSLDARGYYAAEIMRLYQLSRLRHEADKLLVAASEPDANPQCIYNSFDHACLDMGKDSRNEIVTAGESAQLAIRKQVEARDEGKHLGFATGIFEVDDLTGGFFPGHLILLSGRSYSGKTALALNFASYFARKKRRVLFVSLEMTHDELMERVLSDRAEIDNKQWLRGGMSDVELQRLRDEKNEIDEWPFEITTSPCETVNSIRAKARLQKARHGELHLIVVDNLQRMQPRNYRQERYSQLIDSTAELKNLARELNCAVLLLSQLKTDSDARPTDADYSEAKGIIREADLAMMLHRSKEEPRGELILNKIRKGGFATVELGYIGKWYRFHGVNESQVPRYSTSIVDCGHYQSNGVFDREY